MGNQNYGDWSLEAAERWFLLANIIAQDADLRLRGDAARADALYMLGDLFEAYIGDDDDAALVATVADALRVVADGGTRVHFAHGNRDFLVGEAFARRAGLALLPEEALVDLYGTPTLLLHGDTLCLDDVAYQRIRVQLRNPSWQRQFLAQPLAARRAFAAQARVESAKHTGTMDAAIMDVTPSAVEQALAEHGVRRMIHGQPIARRCTISAPAGNASCSATGTNKARRCASMPRASCRSRCRWRAESEKSQNQLGATPMMRVRRRRTLRVTEDTPMTRNTVTGYPDRTD